jgi:hypothetical protein
MNATPIWPSNKNLDNNGNITHFQSGFRKHRSTNDHLVRLETFIRKAFVNKQHLESIFLDFEKAYDTTWKYGILKDLNDAGLKDRLPLFISGFLINRHFKAARLQIHVQFHKNFDKVFDSKILWGEQIKLFTYCNWHLQSMQITKKRSKCAKKPLLH